MRPQEEAKDLIENPLPEIVKEEDKNLPTIIWAIDEQIAVLEKRLETLREVRHDSLEKAVKLGFLKNAGYEIVKIESMGDRIVDVNLLRSRFPVMFNTYVATRIALIKSDMAVKEAKAIDESDKKIVLGLADKVFGKDNVTLCSTKMVSVKYVVKKVEDAR